MTQKIFSQFTGISEGTLSGVFNGRTRPTLQIVEAILQHFPKISLDWLMTGNGPMYKDAAAAHEAGGQDNDAAAAQNAMAAPSAPSQPSLSFGETRGGDYADAADYAKEGNEKIRVKYVDKPQRKITEIRIFYDDQTWETFVPKK